MKAQTCIQGKVLTRQKPALETYSRTPMLSLPVGLQPRASWLAQLSKDTAQPTDAAAVPGPLGSKCRHSGKSHRTQGRQQQTWRCGRKTAHPTHARTLDCVDQPGSSQTACGVYTLDAGQGSVPAAPNHPPNRRMSCTGQHSTAVTWFLHTQHTRIPPPNTHPTQHTRLNSARPCACARQCNPAPGSTAAAPTLTPPSSSMLLVVLGARKGCRNLHKRARQLCAQHDAA